MIKFHYLYVMILFIAANLSNSKTLNNPKDEESFFTEGLDVDLSIDNVFKENEDIPKESFQSFLPKPKRPHVVGGSPMTHYFISKNSLVPNEYVRADIEYNALNNLKLRQHFMNNKAKFDKLSNALKQIEEELVTTNSMIDDFRENTKSRIDDINEYMKNSFENVRLDIDTLGTKVGALTNTIDSNERKMGRNLQDLNKETSELNKGSGDALKMISSLVSKVEKVKVKDCNPKKSDTDDNDSDE